MPVAVEVLSQLDNLILEGLGGAPGAGQRSPRSWSQARIALGEVARNQGDHPASRTPVLTCTLTFGPPLDQHGRDHKICHSHRPPLRLRCARCPETGVNGVLNSDTFGRAQLRGPPRHFGSASACTLTTLLTTVGSPLAYGRCHHCAGLRSDSMPATAAR